MNKDRLISSTIMILLSKESVKKYATMHDRAERAISECMELQDLAIVTEKGAK